MAINYIRHDEEFYGSAKLQSGDEILGRMCVTEDGGVDLLFVTQPAKVHLTEVVQNEKKAQAVGLKKWQVFSDADFFIIQEDKILTIAPLSDEATMMYKMFVKSEYENVDLEDLEITREVEVNESMGLVGRVEETRRKLEDLFKK